MKRLLLFVITLCALNIVLAQNVGIGTTTPHTSAMLEVQATGKGILIPRMPQAEVSAIASPPQGLILFNTTTNSFQYYNGALWANITNSGIVTGTSNRVAKFSGAWGLANGMMTDNGSGVGINITGANADASAIVDLTSTTKGVLVPRMTSAQRTTIATPATGLLVYDNTTNSFWFYNGTAWTELAAGGGGSDDWTASGTDIYNNNTGNVGIGAPIPTHKLTVNGDAIIGDGLGIATTTPDLISHKLDVNGSARTRLDHHVNRDLWVDRNFDVDGTSNLLGNIIAGGNLSIGGNITSVDNVTVSQNLTVDGGKGIVRSNNSAQRVIIYPSGAVGWSGTLAAGYTVDVTFALSNVFSSNPVISLGNFTGVSGQFERFICTIHSIDIVAHNFQVRFFCPAGTTVPTSMTLNFMAIGTAL